MMSNPNQTPFTNEPALAQALGIESVYIKHEYQNPSGSHKDRTIWPMIDYYKEQGISKFVISSSGNAAISAAYYTRLHTDIELEIFVSPQLPEKKSQRLMSLIEGYDKVKLHKSNNAKSDAFKLGKKGSHQYLRTSTDDLALAGYESLAVELTDQCEESHTQINQYSIFIPTSSGTTLQGLYDGFLKQKVNPALHAVQTTKVHTIVKELDQSISPTQSSLSSAIVDTIGHRKQSVLEAIKNSHGSGWVVDDASLQRSYELIKKHVDMPVISWDSLVSLAGLEKSIKQNNNITHAILLFCGK